MYWTIVVVGAQLLLLHTSLRLTFASANRDHDGGYGSRAPLRSMIKRDQPEAAARRSGFGFTGSKQVGPARLGHISPI